jgi:30S ribosomal protein S31
MGKGDKRSAKGKRFKGSFGNSRTQKKKVAKVTKKK